MIKNRCSLAAFAVAIGAGAAAAQTAPPAASGTTFAAPVSVYPGTRVYTWTFRVPVLTTEPIEVVTTLRTPKVHGRHWDYEAPTLKSQRFKLGQVAEFSCKYPDLDLPQECHTEWHNVYADLPVLAMERNHIDYDVVEWREEQQRIRIDIPRWTWSERKLTVSVPIFTAEDDARAQATLDAQQADAAKTIDAGIAALDSSIAAVKAQGADPRQLASGDGTAIDLQSLRQTLRDEQQSQFERLAGIRAELRNLEAGETPTAAR
jgi:hypothetical protein